MNILKYTSVANEADMTHLTILFSAYFYLRNLEEDEHCTSLNDINGSVRNSNQKFQSSDRTRAETS